VAGITWYVNTAELEALIKERRSVEQALRDAAGCRDAGERLERRRAEIDDAVRSAMSHSRRHVVATFAYLYPNARAIAEFEAVLREQGWHRTELPTYAWARAMDRGTTFPEAVKVAHDEIDRARAHAEAAVRVSCKFVVNGVRVGSFKVLSV
jgi:Flp pilus assembly protein TadG